MAGTNKITYTLDFRANLTDIQGQLNKLSTSLNAVANKRILKDNPSVEIMNAAKSASILEMNLKKALNVDTGRLDLTKFNMGIKNSGYSLQHLSMNLLKAGKDGQQAFMQMSVAIANSQRSIIRAEGTALRLWNTLKNTARWQISSYALTGLITGLSTSLNYIKDLNKSLNDIRIVSGDSADEMARYAREANNAARALGSTTLDVTNATLIYRQQGDSLTKAAQKAAITIKAANVATEASAEEMSSYLTAVWNSYKVGGEELELYVDKLSKVGAITAVNMSELATSMEKVAATANTVGVSYDQLLATIATVGSVTRQSAETIGTAFKTIYARIGDLKIGEESVDEDGISITLGDISSQLNRIGINVLDVNGDMRDMGTIIEDIGSKWQDMTNAEKQAVAQVIAGKRQYTHVMALFENWDYYKNTLEATADAQGTLNEQNKIFAESWEAASNRVSDSWQKIINSLNTDDALINLINGFAEIIDKIAWIVEAMGGLKGILLLIGSIFTRVYSTQIANGLSSIGFGILNIFNLTERYNAKILEQQRLTIQNAAAQGLIEPRYQEQLNLIYDLAQATNKFNSEKSKMSEANAFIFDQDLQLLNQQVEGVVTQFNRAKEAKENLSSGRMGLSDFNIDTSKLTLTEQEIKDIENALVSCKDDTEQFKKSFLEISFNSSKLKLTENQIKNIETAFKKADANLDSFLSDLKSMNSGTNSLKLTTHQIETIKKAFVESKGNVENFKNSLNGIPVQILNQIISTMDNINSEAEETEQSFNAIKQKIQDFNNNLSQSNKKSSLKQLKQEAQDLSQKIAEAKNRLQVLQNGGGTQKNNQTLETMRKALIQTNGDIDAAKVKFKELTQGTPITSTPEQALKSLKQALGNAGISLEDFIADIQKTKGELDTYGIQLDETNAKIDNFGDNKPKQNLSQTIASGINGLMQLGMIITQVDTLITTFTDDTISWAERFQQALTQVPMILMSLVGGFQALTVAGLSAQAACWWLLAITAVLGGVLYGLKAFDDMNVSVKEAEENLKELNSEFETLKGELDDIKKKQKDSNEAIAEYQDLQKQAVEYGGLTEESRNRMVELSEELVNTYGVEAQGLNSLTNAYNITTESINNYVNALIREREEKEKEILKNRREATENTEIIAEDIAKIKTKYSGKKEAVTSNYSVFYALSGQEESTNQKANDLFNNLESTWEWDDITVEEAIEETVKEGRMNSTEGEYMLKAIQNVLGVKPTDNYDDYVEDKLYSDAGLRDKLYDEMSRLIKEDGAKVEEDLKAQYAQMGSNAMTAIQMNLPDVMDGGLGFGMLSDSMSAYLNSDEGQIKNLDEYDKYVEKSKNFFDTYGESLEKAGQEMQEANNLIAQGKMTTSDYTEYLNAIHDQMVYINKAVDNNLISYEEKINNLKKYREIIENDMGLTMAFIKQMGDLGNNKSYFNNLEGRFVKLQQMLREGTITSSDYFEELSNQVENMDLEAAFGKSTDAAKMFFAAITEKATESMNSLKADLDSGKINLHIFTKEMTSIADSYGKIAEKAEEFYASTGDESDKKISNIFSQWAEDLKEANEELLKIQQVIPKIIDTSNFSISGLASSLEELGITMADMERIAKEHNIHWEVNENATKSIEEALEDSGEATRYAQEAVADHTEKVLAKQMHATNAIESTLEYSIENLEMFAEKDADGNYTISTTDTGGGSVNREDIKEYMGKIDGWNQFGYWGGNGFFSASNWFKENRGADDWSYNLATDALVGATNEGSDYGYGDMLHHAVTLSIKNAYAKGASSAEWNKWKSILGSAGFSDDQINTVVSTGNLASVSIYDKNKKQYILGSDALYKAMEANDGSGAQGWEYGMRINGTLDTGLTISDALLLMQSASNFAKNSKMTSSSVKTVNNLDLSAEDITNWDQLTDVQKEAIDSYFDLEDKLRDAEKKLADAWDEEYLARLEEDLKRHQQILDEYQKQIENVDWFNGLLPEDSFLKLQNQTEQYGRNINQLTSQLDEFNRVYELIPRNAEEAQAIFEQLSSLGDGVKESVEQIHSLKYELMSLESNMFTTILDENGEILDSEFDRLDKLHKAILDSSEYSESTKNLLLRGGSSALQLDNGKKDRVKQREEEDKKIYNLVEELDEKIFQKEKELLEITSKETAKEREKERKKITEEINDITKEIQDKITQLHNDLKIDEYQYLLDITGKHREATDKIRAMWASVGVTFPNDDEDGDGKTSSSKKLKMRISDNTDQYLSNTAYYHPLSDYSDYQITQLDHSWNNTPYSAIDLAPNSSEEKPDVYSLAEGTVIFAGKNGNYGNLVKIKDKNNSGIFYYAHLDSIGVSEGDEVSAGQYIGVMGNTGKTTGTHLHLERRDSDDKMINTFDFNLLSFDPKLSYYQGIDKSPRGKSLVGEIGAELIIYPDGSSYLAGINGPEVLDLPQGTQVFNAQDTQNILNSKGTPNGNIQGFANGTEGNVIIEDNKDLQENTEALKENTEAIIKDNTGLDKEIEDIKNSLKNAEDFEKKFNSNLYANRMEYDFATQITSRKLQNKEISEAQYYVEQGRNQKLLGQIMQNEAEGLMLEYERQRDEYFKKGIYNEETEENLNKIYNKVIELSEKGAEMSKKADEQLSEYVQKQIEGLEAISSEIEYQYQLKIDAMDKEIQARQNLIDLQQSYNSHMKELRQIENDIEKTLRQSKANVQWLDRETRDLLFNQTDYYKILQKTNSIQFEITQLHEDYQEKISNLNEYELDQASLLTEEYEAQVAAKKEELETLKISLQLNEKQNALNNALMERNVRVFAGGRWHQVANTQNVQKAYEDYQGVVNQLKEQEITNAENKAIREEEALNRELELKKAAYEAEIAMMQEENEKLKHELDVMTSEFNISNVSLKKWNEQLLDVNRVMDEAYEGLKNFGKKVNGNFSNGVAYSSYNGGGSSFGGSSGGGQNSDYVNWAKNQMAENSKNWFGADKTTQDALAAANKNLASQIGATQNSDGHWIDKNGNKITGNARGRKDGPGGISQVNELGIELLATNSGQFIELNPHEKIFNNEQMNFLYDFSRRGIESTEKAVSSVSAYNDESMTIENLTVELPNVTDTNSFVEGLKGLKEHMRNVKTIR